MFKNLILVRSAGRYLKLLAGFAKSDLLVLNDYALAPLNQEQRHDLLEILEERHGCKSTLVTKQLPLEHWRGTDRRSHPRRYHPGPPDP